MKQEEGKWLQEIRNAFHNIEVPYEEGSWEEFQKSSLLQSNKQRERRRLIFWLFPSAAALLIGVLLLIPDQDKQRNAAGAVQKTTSPGSTQRKEAPAFPLLRQETLAKKPAVQEEVRMETARAVPSTLQEPPESPVAMLYNDAQEDIQELVPSPPLEPAPARSPQTEEEKLLDPIIHDTSKPEEVDEALPSRWKFGLEIHYTVASQQPGMATGIITQFALSPKLKFSTGITYSQLSTLHRVDPLSISPVTKIVGGETSLQALDIPINVIFEPLEGWFGSVGISALALLDERKTYHMENMSWRESTVVNPQTGAMESVSELIINKYHETSAHTDFTGRGNLGYLNFSLGRKQRIRKKSDLLIEPFAKFPLAGLRNADIPLFHSGLKVKFLF